MIFFSIKSINIIMSTDLIPTLERTGKRSHANPIRGQEQPRFQ